MGEPLLPELKPYLQKNTQLGDQIFHPLIYWPFYTPEQNDLINKCYTFKKEQIKKAIKEKDIHHILMLHEKPYRPQVLIEFFQKFKLSPKEKGKLIIDIWINTENPHQNIHIWKPLFNNTPQKYLTIEKNDRNTLKNLPDKITIYRGQHLKQKPTGISWTLNPDIAEWFSKRFNKNNHIIKKTVQKNQIKAYTNQRNEEEIIFFK